QRTQGLECKEPGVVPIVPGNLVGVVADWRNGDWTQGNQLGRLEDAQWIGWGQSLLATAGAGAVFAQMRPVIVAAMPIAPDDDEAVIPLLAERDGLDRQRWRRAHGALPSERLRVSLMI